VVGKFLGVISEQSELEQSSANTIHTLLLTYCLYQRIAVVSESNRLRQTMCHISSSVSG
jgi:hypothetical protein